MTRRDLAAGVAVLERSPRSLARRARTRLDRARNRRRKLLFVFPGGVGASGGMGVQLYGEEPAFRSSVDACSEVVEGRLGFSPAAAFRGEASGDDDDLGVAWRNKTVLLAITQLALTDLWRANGVTPEGIVALSLGEATAGYAAGSRTRNEVMAVVCSIARAISERPRKGVIFVVGAGIEVAKRLSGTAPRELAFLGEMGPQLTMLLAAAEDTSVLEPFVAQSAPVLRAFPTDWTYHTTLQPFDRKSMIEELAAVPLRPFQVPIYSSMVGGRLPDGLVIDGAFAYWSMTHPFYYGEALSAALDDGFDLVVNVGTGAIMTAWMQGVAEAQGAKVEFVESMGAPEAELATWRRAVAQVAPRTRPRKRRPPRLSGGSAGLDGHEPLDLTRPDVARDPIPYLVGLQRRGAVHFLPRQECWLAVGYDAVRSALLKRTEYAHADLGALGTALGTDGPEHAAMRRLISSRFSSQAVPGLKAYTAELAERLLAPLMDALEFDVVGAFAVPLSELVAARLLDLDDVALDAVRSPAGAPVRPPAILVGAAKDAIAPVADRIPLYRELRDQRGVPEDAAVGLMALLWVAATSTTKSALASSVLLLGDSPERREIAAAPDRLPLFVEESLRLNPPELMVTRQTTTQVSLGGVSIPPRSRVLLAIAAANRDPARFPDPDRPIVGRPNHREHLSFAAGAHHCLGVHVARVELTTALATLLRMMPDFEVLEPPGVRRYVRSSNIRALEQLMIAA